MSSTNKILISLKEALKPSKPVDFDFKGAASKPMSGNHFYTDVKAGAKWFPFGEYDNTPTYLEELAEGSSIHGAILKTKSLMISGEGLLINGAKTPEETLAKIAALDIKQRTALRLLETNPYVKEKLQDAIDCLADNYSISGAFAYLVTWNKDFTMIASYQSLNIKYLRAAVPEDRSKNIKSYYYSEDGFDKVKVSDMKEYFIYDQKDKAHYTQIVYEKDGFNRIYGTPSYKGAFKWINIDIQLGVFHEANIENGMNPGLHFKFYTVPDSDEEKQFIINQIKKNWLGAMNTGRFVPTFSKSKELATEVVPIETSGLDKQLLNLTELSDRKIISGHQLPSPLLAGISTAGQLGAGTELKTAFILWNGLVIRKMRQRIENSLQDHIFDINIPKVEIKINPFNPIKELLDAENADKNT